jgi:hypothetical protein
MRLTRVLDFASKLRRRPLLVNVRRLLQRIPLQPLDINCLYFLEHSGLPTQRPHVCRGRAEIRSADQEDLEGMARCQNTPLAFMNRFGSNDYCVVALVDGRIVGYEWFSVKPLCVEERYSYAITVPSDAIYAYDAFIVPEYRLGGIWLKFNSVYVRELMCRLSRKKIITTIDYGNRVSMNTHLRFGFKIWRVVFIIKVLGKSFFLTRTLRGNKTTLPRWASITDKPGTRLALQ